MISNEIREFQRVQSRRFYLVTRCRMCGCVIRTRVLEDECLVEPGAEWPRVAPEHAAKLAIGCPICREELTEYDHHEVDCKDGP